MWVGTSKQGVAYSCLNEVVFDNIICSNQEDISCILEDKEGNVWMGFDGEGINCFKDGKEDKRFCKRGENTAPSKRIVCSSLD